jgi:hypothetical protein
MQIFYKTVEIAVSENTVFRKFTKWTLTERHVIIFWKQLINLLYQPAWTILVKLDEINMTPLIILNKTQSFIIGYNFSFIIYKYMININYYMAFFISCPLSALGHDISPRADRLKG